MMQQEYVTLQQSPLMVSSQPMLQPQSAPSTALPFGKGYRIAIIILGSIGFLFCVAALAVSLNLSFDGGLYVAPAINGLILVVLNFAYIICTCRIIYIVSSSNSPSVAHLQDLKSVISWFTAWTIGGFALFCSITGWFGNEYYDQYPITYWNEYQAETSNFACSFIFLWNIPVISVTGVYMKKSNWRLESHSIFLTNALPNAISTQPAAQAMSPLNHQQITSLTHQQVSPITHQLLPSPIQYQSRPTTPHQIQFSPQQQVPFATQQRAQISSVSQQQVSPISHQLLPSAIQQQSRSTTPQQIRLTPQQQVLLATQQQSQSTIQQEVPFATQQQMPSIVQEQITFGSEKQHQQQELSIATNELNEQTGSIGQPVSPSPSDGSSSDLGISTDQKLALNIEL